VDEEATDPQPEDADGLPPPADTAAVSASVRRVTGSVEEAPATADEGLDTADAIVALEWDDELPVVSGEESVVSGDATADATDDDSEEEYDYGDEGDDLGVLSDDRVAGRRNALPRRLESWRSRSATGAIATALAMGLQQVFEPEKRRPAAVAEAPGNPYSDTDPITVDYVPDDAESTTVHVKPWLLGKDDPS